MLASEFLLTECITEQTIKLIVTRKTAISILAISLLIGVFGGCRGERVGAVCNDGWKSGATGRGACSHHGGVDYWLYD